jgi:molecular chaperone GrpE
MTAPETDKDQVQEPVEPEEVEAEVLEGEEPETGTEASEAAIEDGEAKALAAAKEWQDKYLRLHAEWDTYRRRMKEQREEERQRATEKLVESLIPIVDDFERTIAYAKTNGEEGLLGGVEAVYNKLADTLTKNGVEILDPAGEAYDALAAQAVGVVDDPSMPDETVAQVYQKGFRMGNKVLRPAMVTVTTGGPKREVEEADED